MVNMNTDIKNTMRQYTTCLEYQQTQPQGVMIPCKLLCRIMGVVSANVFVINNKTLLCIVDYYRKFPVMKKVGSHAVDSLVQMTKMLFVEYRFSKKIITDAGINFISEMFRHFCRGMSIQQSLTSSHHHQSNDQAEACMKCVKHTIQMP